MILSSLTRAHAQACGVSMEDAVRIVAEANQFSKPTHEDDGVCPYERFKARLARPNADLPRRQRTVDFD